MGAINQSGPGQIYEESNGTRTMMVRASGVTLEAAQIDVDITPLVDVVGATDDAAATAGGEGTISAKLRVISADVASLLAAVGDASDAAGDPTVIGLLKQIAANTEPA